MTDLSTRKMASADRPDVEALLDDSIGRGFWDPTRDLDDIVLVGTKDGRLVGVASARVGSDPAATEPPVGHLRLVAVAPSARRHGVATRLVAEVTEVCRSYGARDLIAYAWVHGPGGIAPLAGALERVGYVFDRRIENFYGGAVAAPCPACRRSPCICAADLYRLDADGADGGGEESTVSGFRGGDPVPTGLGSPGQEALVLDLVVLPDLLAVCRLPPGSFYPSWVAGCEFQSVTRTTDETSVVCPAAAVPADVQVEPGWRALKVGGPLDFGLTGVLLSIARCLAEAGVSIFAMSTYDTDYVLVKESLLEEAVAALEAAGHRVGRPQGGPRF